VIGFIAGLTAPPGRRMGHAGAIISGGKGTAKDKIETMRSAGIHIVENPAEIGITVHRVIKEQKIAELSQNAPTKIKRRSHRGRPIVTKTK